ncbi:MAG: hypothetical protein AAFY85_06420 [Pseudomonadota bacterium]
MVLGGLAVGVSSIGWSESSPSQTRQETYRQLDLFAEILSRAQNEYVEQIDEAEAR